MTLTVLGAHRLVDDTVLPRYQPLLEPLGRLNNTEALLATNWKFGPDGRAWTYRNLPDVPSSFFMTGYVDTSSHELSPLGSYRPGGGVPIHQATNSIWLINPIRHPSLSSNFTHTISNLSRLEAICLHEFASVEAPSLEYHTVCSPLRSSTSTSTAVQFLHHIFEPVRLQIVN